MKAVDTEETELDAELLRLGAEAEGHLSVLRTLGDSGTKSQASELSKNVEKVLKSMRSSLRDLEQLTEEQETKEASLRVAQLLGNHKVRYDQIKKNQESAFVEMRRNSEKAWRKMRQDLLSGAVSRGQIADEKTAVAASEGITESLRRTRQMMTEQITQTEGNTQLIGTSTQRLEKTHTTLRSQKELFGSSRRLLNAMSWQDVLDKIVLYGGVTFFLVVVLYILQKRMLGLTPQIVKSSVSNLITKSLDSTSELYTRFVSVKEDQDPAKQADDLFDDLDSVLDSDLIKAVPEAPPDPQDFKLPEDSVSSTDLNSDTEKELESIQQVDTPPPPPAEPDVKEAEPVKEDEDIYLDEEEKNNDLDIKTSYPDTDVIAEDISLKTKQQGEDQTTEEKNNDREVMEEANNVDAEPVTAAEEQSSDQGSEELEDPYLDEDPQTATTQDVKPVEASSDADEEVIRRAAEEEDIYLDVEEEEEEDIYLDDESTVKDTLVLPSTKDEL